MTDKNEKINNLIDKWEAFRTLHIDDMPEDLPHITQDLNKVGGKRWAVTGDYFVQIPTIDEFVDISRGFTVITKTERSDGFTSFWLMKPEKENVQALEVEEKPNEDN